MWLFLVSLSILFLASLVGYVLMHVMWPQQTFTPIKPPNELWLSTLLILASSFTIQRALMAIRREKQSLFRIYLSATMMFSALFVCIQTPAMANLLNQHHAAQEKRNREIAIVATQPTMTPRPSALMEDERIVTPHVSVPFHGLAVSLIFIHALHVVGGIVALGIVAYYGYKGAYDHEHHTGVTNCTLYWHFLDAVWIIMLTVIVAFR